MKDFQNKTKLINEAVQAKLVYDLNRQLNKESLVSARRHRELYEEAEKRFHELQDELGVDIEILNDLENNIWNLPVVTPRSGTGRRFAYLDEPVTADEASDIKGRLDKNLYYIRRQLDKADELVRKSRSYWLGDDGSATEIHTKEKPKYPISDLFDKLDKGYGVSDDDIRSTITGGEWETSIGYASEEAKSDIADRLLTDAIEQLLKVGAAVDVKRDFESGITTIHIERTK